MGIQLSSMLKYFYQCDVKNDNKADSSIEENVTKKVMKILKQLIQKPEEKSLVIIHDAKRLKTSVSVDKLIDSFVYFIKRNNLKHSNENNSVLTLTNLSKASFITLYKLATNGKSNCKNIISFLQ